MPEEYENVLLYLKDAIPVTLGFAENDIAKREAKKYLDKEDIIVENMKPLSVYYILKELNDIEQINFIKQHLSYIRKNDRDVFLYNMWSPKSLSYYLSLNTIKEIRKIDTEIFHNMISYNIGYLFHGLSYKDKIEFFDIFYEDILNVSNDAFIRLIFEHIDCALNNEKDIKKLLSNFVQEQSNDSKCIKMIIEKYKDKIDSFNARELYKFSMHISDVDIYNELIINNKEKFKKIFEDFDEYSMSDYIEDIGSSKHKVIIDNFIDIIMNKKNPLKIILCIAPYLVLNIYNERSELFCNFKLNDWVKICKEGCISNIDYKNIIDSYEIDDFESLFDSAYYLNYWNQVDTESLEYVEKKYRNSIKINNELESITDKTSIFSKEYIKNLEELKEKLINKETIKNLEEYKNMLSNFIIFLRSINIVFDIEKDFKELDKLFYKIVKGESLTIVYKVKTIQDIALYNRLGSLEFSANDFTVDQIETYNVKQHKKLCEEYNNSSFLTSDYKKLILKLLLLVGYNNSRKILEIDSDKTTLEHLVGNVDIKNIKDYNIEALNMIFNSKEQIEKLKDKSSDLYKYFPRIFSEWKIIKMNQKDKNLNTIIEFLKTDEISVPPEYHRLVGLFKYIGCDNTKVEETLKLHDKILEREESTIPTVNGTYNDYTYEVLDVNSMEGLTVGSITNCCFTVLGNGYSCLKHALTCKNGRVLVIKKGNEIIAHSWLWRNGNLLCLDNVEVSKSISEVNFFDIYLKIADEIIQLSEEKEKEDGIQNITIGVTSFDKKINGIEKYPCFISKLCNFSEKDFHYKIGKNRMFLDKLPQPIEEVSYSDSKNVQYLIRGNGNFILKDPNYNYLQKEKVKVK